VVIHRQEYLSENVASFKTVAIFCGSLTSCVQVRPLRLSYAATGPYSFTCSVFWKGANGFISEAWAMLLKWIQMTFWASLPFR